MKFDSSRELTVEVVWTSILLTKFTVAKLNYQVLAD
jgi:hypothetical protein